MGVGSSLPAPSFPLRREILAQGGSLLVSVCLVWVVLHSGGGGLGWPETVRGCSGDFRRCSGDHPNQNIYHH